MPTKKKKKVPEKTLIFLCTGNTCRGIMAEMYFKALLAKHKIRNVEIRSAGVMTVPGLLPTQEVKLLLNQEGIQLGRHLSKPLTKDMIKKATLLLGMTPFHVQSAKRLSDEARGKTFLLKEYTGEGGGKRYRIPDPMGCTMEVYTRVFKEIKKSCERLLKKEFLPSKKPVRKVRKVKKKVAVKRRKIRKKSKKK